MGEYIKDYCRVSKLNMHYQRYILWIRLGFGLALIIGGGNLQWTILFMAMVFSCTNAEITFDGVAYILPLTDEERFKRQITGVLVPILELFVCGAMGKVIWYIVEYIMESRGIIGNADELVLVRYPLFSAVFFIVSVIVAADIVIEAILGMTLMGMPKSQGEKRRYLLNLILQGYPGFVFITYGIAMGVNFHWIYSLDELGNAKHLIRLLVCGALLLIHIILVIHRAAGAVLHDEGVKRAKKA